MFQEIINLIYPRICHSCETALLSEESEICFTCKMTLPKIDNLYFETELLERKFWGKIHIKNTYSFLKFSKKGKVQRLLYALKYNNQPKLGVFLGEWYAEELKKKENFQQFDLIIPIPLHKNRLKERGYNQAEMIANGISNKIPIPSYSNALVRDVGSFSQTKLKSRVDRYENLKGIFRVAEPNKIENKSVLIVDDVLTTGATLESAADSLLKSGAKEISVLTIASAI